MLSRLAQTKKTVVQKLSYQIKRTQELITYHFLSFLLLKQLPKTEKVNEITWGARKVLY